MKSLPKFRHFSKFTLVGGTALALQLGHRLSVDFDWFTETADIAVMKAYVFGRRLAFKDYVDLYFIFKQKAASLDRVIKNCQEIYQGEFHARLFLEQLLNPEDIKQGRIDFLKIRVSRSQIKSFFERLVGSVKI